MNVITCNRLDVFEEVKKVVKGAYVFINTDQNSLIHMEEGDQALIDTCWVILERLALIGPPVVEMKSSGFEPLNPYTTYINEKLLNQEYTDVK